MPNARPSCPANDAERDPIQIADENRPCQKVRQETGSRQPRGNTANARHHGQRHRQGDGTRRVASGERKNRGRHDRARGGVGSHDQLPGGTKERVRNQWKDAGVKPVSRGETCKRGIGDRYRDGYGGDRHACQEIGTETQDRS